MRPDRATIDHWRDPRGGGCEPAHRELRLHRQHGVRGAGRVRRLDRLAVSAALRFGRLFCGLAPSPRIMGAGPSAPHGETKRTQRRYLPGTAILETTFETADGVTQVIDFMPRTADAEYVDVIPLGARHARPGQDAYRADRALRLRLYRAMGAPAGLRDQRHRRPRRSSCHAGRAARRGLHHRRRVQRR